MSKKLFALYKGNELLDVHDTLIEAQESMDDSLNVLEFESEDNNVHFTPENTDFHIQEYDLPYEEDEVAGYIPFGQASLPIVQ